MKLDPKRIKWTNESMRTHNDLSWDQVFSPPFVRSLDSGSLRLQVRAKLEAGDPVIANVMSGTLSLHMTSHVIININHRSPLCACGWI